MIAYFLSFGSVSQARLIMGFPLRFNVKLFYIRTLQLVKYYNVSFSLPIHEKWLGFVTDSSALPILIPLLHFAQGLFTNTCKGGLMHTKFLAPPPFGPHFISGPPLPPGTFPQGKQASTLQKIIQTQDSILRVKISFFFRTPRLSDLKI